MANGPGEIILLCAGLIVAGLVSGVLLETWDDMDAALEDRGKEGAADVRTRASLVNDPLNIAWDNTEKIRHGRAQQGFGRGGGRAREEHESYCRERLLKAAKCNPARSGYAPPKNLVGKKS